MDSRPAEFHCGYAANEQEALEKGRGILEKFGKYIKEGQIVDLGCGEGALLLALKRAGKKQILGVDSNEELLGIARTVDVPLVENDIWEYLRIGDCCVQRYISIWMSWSTCRSSKTWR